MKVLALNGSPRPIGNTSNILLEMQDMFEIEGIEMEIIHLYEYEFTNCNVCLTCEISGDGRCMDEDDGLNDILDRMRAADAILLAAPTYAGACPSVMQAFMERAALVFEKGDLGLRGKVGGCFAVCAREGGDMVYNQMSRFLLRNGMLVCGANPVPIIRALNSPQYADDVQGMRGIKALVEGMSSALMRLNGYYRIGFGRRRTRSPLRRRSSPRPPASRLGRSSGARPSSPPRGGLP